MEKFEGLSSVELISDEELYEIEGGGAWASNGNIVKKIVSKAGVSDYYFEKFILKVASKADVHA